MRPIVLHADHLILMDRNNTVIPNGAVVVGSDGRIQAAGEADPIIAANPGIHVKRLENRLLMPGLVNTHAHSGLLRGTAEGLPVWEWLEKFIDPMHRVVNEREAEIASWLCYAEALLSGTTTIVDMWRHIQTTIISKRLTQTKPSSSNGTAARTAESMCGWGLSICSTPRPMPIN